MSPPFRTLEYGPQAQRPGSGLEDTGRIWPEPPRERVTSVSPPPSPPSALPDPRCPTRPRPGHRAAAARLGLGPAPWRRVPRSPRPAPPRPGPHSRHAPSSGSPRRCEDELGVLGALATLLLSGLRSPPPGDRRLNSLLPLGSGFLLLRRKCYLESNPNHQPPFIRSRAHPPRGPFFRFPAFSFCFVLLIGVLKQGLSTWPWLSRKSPCRSGWL